MSYDPDMTPREQRLIDRGWTIRYYVTDRRYASVCIKTLKTCAHRHARRETAWNCAERRAK